MVKTVLVLAFLVCTFGCAQVLESPCVGKPVSASCPACAGDTDCGIASNLCQPTASCVPTAGNWAVVAIGCEVQYLPTTTPCGCVEGVCQARK